MNLTKRQEEILSSIYKAITGNSLTEDDLLNVAIYTKTMKVAGEQRYIPDWSGLGIESANKGSDLVWAHIHSKLANRLGVIKIPPKSIVTSAIDSKLDKCEPAHLAIPCKTAKDRVIAVYEKYGAIVHKSQFLKEARETNDADIIETSKKYFLQRSHLVSTSQLIEYRDFISGIIAERQAYAKITDLPKHIVVPQLGDLGTATPELLLINGFTVRTYDELNDVAVLEKLGTTVEVDGYFKRMKQFFNDNNKEISGAFEVKPFYIQLGGIKPEWNYTNIALDVYHKTGLLPSIAVLPMLKVFKENDPQDYLNQI